jgi:phospholipid transport system substrate-binding protein
MTDALSISCRTGLGRLAFALATALAVAQPAAAQSGDRAEGETARAAAAKTYVVELVDTAVRQLGDPEVAQETRAARARAMLEANFAGRDLTRFVLGRWARIASEDQLERLQTLLREVALKRFLPAFQHLDREQVAVTRATADPQAKGLARVDTRIDIPDQSAVTLSWRVRPKKEGDGFEIVDVMAEGVSMAITLRSEYTSMIKRNGGQVDALLSELERRLETEEAQATAWERRLQE